jgi:hypothetical protein
MYLAEKEANPEKFSNFADALWWGVVSVFFFFLLPQPTYYFMPAPLPVYFMSIHILRKFSDHPVNGRLRRRFPNHLARQTNRFRMRSHGNLFFCATLRKFIGKLKEILGMIVV